MASRIDKARKAALAADDAVASWGEQVAARYIVSMNKTARLVASSVIQALDLATDKRGGILLTAGNIQAINGAMAAGDARMNKELVGLIEGQLGGWVDQAALAGANAFGKVMQAAAVSKFRIGVNPLLAQVAKARVITQSKSLNVQAASRVQGVIFDMMRGRRSIKQLKDIVISEAGVNESLAKTIARSETFATYRAAQDEQYRENGYEYYEMVGPLDSTTSDICRRYLGNIKTRDEWLDIEEMVFDYGLHPDCRHSWIGVQQDWMEKSEWEAARK